MNSKAPKSPTNHPALQSLTLSALLVLNMAFAGVSRAQQNPQPSSEKPAAQKPAAEKPDAGATVQQHEPAGKPGDRDLQGGTRITREGVTIQMSLTPASDSSASAPPRELMGGDDATLMFKIQDEATGNPLSGVRPAAWLDRRELDSRGPRETTGKDCREKIQAFLQGSLSARPTLDLNSYYILTLNREPTISVIDPLLGYGTTKLLTLVFLNNPGEDWVQTRDGKRIYVTMPASNQIAVIDTVTFKVIANISTGIKPLRIALQNDQKYLWVGCDAVPEANQPSGVSIIDTATNKVVSHIQTGAGRHEIVFTSDDRFAFVTNDSAGTVTIIDVSKLAVLKTLAIGKRLTSIAYSSLSNSVYIADEVTGVLSVVEGRMHEKTSSIKLEPGAGVVRFAPSGRLGVALNSRDNSVSAFDAATNKVIQRFEVEPGPDQVSFTTGYAYIRSFKSDHVTLIPIAALEKGGSTQVVRIPGGQASPEQSGPAAVAGAIVPAP
jgi:YVTN family beta-propeller protein